MIRKIIALTRAAIIGPTLTTLSRLREDELANLLLLPLLGGDAPAASSPLVALPASVGDTLAELKNQIAQLSERVDVLERLTRR